MAAGTYKGNFFEKPSFSLSSSSSHVQADDIVTERYISETMHYCCSTHELIC